jgi:DNA-binding winged helix-turn-helix (wHTH) protein/tetratricopeptide (TPR) repeat protein
MLDPVKSPAVYRFGVYAVSAESRELLRQGRQVKIQDQPFELLLLFLEHPGEILDRQFFRERLWPGDTYVDFAQSLSTAVTKLRQVLGDDAANPRFIETVPRHGYRFIAPVFAAVQNMQPLLPVEPSVAAAAPTIPSAAAVATTPASPATPALVDSAAAISFGKRIKRTVLGASVAAVIALLIFLYVHHRRSGFVLAAQDTVVLADFENTTGESIFNDTLHQALIVEMAQSPVLHILSDRSAAVVYRQMGHSPDDRMTGRTVIELCRRVGGKVVVQGSISSLGTTYLIGLAGIRCDTGKPIAHEQVEAARTEEVIDALGKTAAKLRARLGESLPSIQKYNAPLELATTSSLDALKMYSQALSTWDAKGDLASLPYFNKAIALDPEFAMAYGGLATVHNNIGQADLARDDMVKAFALRARVTEAERASIEARYYLYVTEEVDKAAQTYAVLAREYPDSAGSLNHLATAELKLGHNEEAADHLRKAIQIDPTRAVTYGNLALALMHLNRLEEAAAVLADADKRGLRTGYWLQVNYWLAFLNGNQQEMERSVLASATIAGAKPLLLSEEADTEAYHGRYRNALALSFTAAGLMQAAGDKESAAGCLARAAMREAEVGNAANARSMLTRARSLSSDKFIQISQALIASQLGDTKQALLLSEALDKQYPQGTFIQNFWLPVIRAKAEMRQGHAPRAILSLPSSSTLDPAVADEVGINALFPTYVRGQAYLAGGDSVRAAAEFRKVIERRGIVVNSPLGSLAYLGLARTMTLAGQPDQAAQAYRDLFSRWGDPDPELPQVREARAEAQRLAKSH